MHAEFEIERWAVHLNGLTAPLMGTHCHCMEGSTIYRGAATLIAANLNGVTVSKFMK